jgi:hypothetical protein
VESDSDSIRHRLSQQQNRSSAIQHRLEDQTVSDLILSIKLSDQLFDDSSLRWGRFWRWFWSHCREGQRDSFLGQSTDQFGAEELPLLLSVFLPA